MSELPPPVICKVCNQMTEAFYCTHENKIEKDLKSCRKVIDIMDRTIKLLDGIKDTHGYLDSAVAKLQSAMLEVDNHILKEQRNPTGKL